MTPIVPGKSYSHRDEWLRAPVGVAALCIPVGYNGRLGHESVFKILSNDRSVSCFLHFHDAASPAPRGWISVPFALENQQMQPVGSASTINGAHVRRFEHGIRLPHAGGGAQKNLQPATSFLLRGREEGFR